MTHTPVLVREVIELFQPSAGSSLLDATVGTGGHTRSFLAAAGPQARTVALDTDPAALVKAKQTLQAYSKQITFINGNFVNLKDSLTGGGILTSEENNAQTSASPMFTHILFDLGIGSHQLADPTRGFSFRSLSHLSMLYGPAVKLPRSELESINTITDRLGHYPEAFELIQMLTIPDLSRLIRAYGEEKFAIRIAKALKELPAAASSRQVAASIAATVPPAYRRQRIHPATRTFQALRLAVNRELESLATALPQAFSLLARHGIVGVISFHSLEDRIVKQAFRNKKQQNESWHLLTAKPVTASQQEIRQNHRSRSAKLRALKKD